MFKIASEITLMPLDLDCLFQGAVVKNNNNNNFFEILF